MDATELAWAAGLFEGEGSVRIDRPHARQRATLYVVVSNTDREIVVFFQARWSAYVKPVSGSGVGARRQAWAWAAAALKAAAFLEDVLPHLRTARMVERAQLGLEFQAQKSRVGTRDRAYRERQVGYYNRMTVLNHRGTGPLPAPYDGGDYLTLPDSAHYRRAAGASDRG